MGWYLFVSDIRTDLSNMKFLVLALCVCAASAATFGGRPFGQSPFGQAAQAVAQVGAPVAVQAARVAYTPAAVVAKAVVGPAVVASPVPKPAVVAQVSPATKNVYTDSDAQVVSYENEVAPDNFRYAYETNNGIFGQSSGTLKQVGDAQVLVQSGSYRYVDPSGQTIEVTYVADENGFQPQGQHLPVAPPVPEDIARSIEYIASRAAYAAKNA
ncbi:uncharacterized protein LOC142972974 [Anticarsia gemmatalis]|uniref:uncharacterized protein LOC142972974 n=1 Tax=Anticarsia gemmatalis TaxID=129554 RepID=UPI003F75C718